MKRKLPLSAFRFSASRLFLLKTQVFRCFLWRRTMMVTRLKASNAHVVGSGTACSTRSLPFTALKLFEAESPV